MIFKLIGIAILGVTVVLLLRGSRPEFAVLAVIATGVIIIIVMLSSLSSVIVSFNAIVEKSGLSEKLFGAVLKIIGIGYLTEYSSSICEDCGCGSIASKLQIGGKLVIFMMSFPIITALVDSIAALLTL